MSDLILCRTCKELRPSGNFYVQPDGFRHKTCLRCNTWKRVATEKRIIARRGLTTKPAERLTDGGMTGVERRAYWATYKMRAGCSDCGMRDWELLEFDHLPEYEKSFNIGDAVRKTGYYTDAEIAAEVAKCEVVCRTCHWKRTSRRGPRNSPRTRDVAIAHFPQIEESETNKETS